MLKRTKKGFTLAELLIVVAIIAVLTAIAVPLFVTSIDKANQTVFQSNQDAVRSAGLVEALSDEDYPLDQLGTDKVIVVTGTFTGNKLTSVKISETPVDKTKATSDNPETVYATWKSDKGTIVVWLTATALSKGA